MSINVFHGTAALCTDVTRFDEGSITGVGVIGRHIGVDLEFFVHFLFFLCWLNS